jgi:hypothetical protein
VDDPERDYLRQQIQTLTRSNRWWKALAIGLMGSVVLFLILGMGSIVTIRLSMVRQQRDMEIRIAEDRARREAVMRARQLREKLESEEAKAKGSPQQAQTQ